MKIAIIPPNKYAGARSVEFEGDNTYLTIGMSKQIIVSNPINIIPITLNDFGILVCFKGFK